MRVIAAICVVLTAAAASCYGATLPDLGLPGTGKVETPGPEARDEQRARAPRKPGYVRMPVSRQVFNGTGRWPWGWHWSAPMGIPPGPWAHIPGHAPPLIPTKPTAAEPATKVTKSGKSTATKSLSSSSIASAIHSPEPEYHTIRPRSHADRQWGWAHLEDLGGIAYILQCL